MPAIYVGLGPLYQDPRNGRLVADLAAGETPVNTYMRDGFLFLQAMINGGYLNVDRTFATLPNTGEEISYFSGGNCTCISPICQAKASSHDYPSNVEVTTLPVLPGGVVYVIGAGQRPAARYQVKTFRCILIPETR